MRLLLYLTLTVRMTRGVLSDSVPVSFLHYWTPGLFNRTWKLSDKAMENKNVGAEVVLGGSGEWTVSTGTQTGQHENEVQITVPLQQFMQRIDSFKTLKRQQIDTSNRLEFYSTSRSSSSTSQRGDGESCARTDLIYVRRRPSVPSHITIQKVRNSGGPTPPPLPPVEQLKRDLTPTTQWQTHNIRLKGGGLLHLPERVANLEHCLDLYSGGTTPKDLIQRVQNLEQRLLQLESTSPEYGNLRTTT